ncbi:MAG TPA: bifunctional enoyl-CoA hydratase/phosphate acetyltransferase [Candidatus Ozemobacteraceae bacterium]|nr:bifunctional enoyl-CoA hydratase/phosphate acetyltransferase [Candidatus Ozemobacteraceae bacterium]
MNFSELEKKLQANRVPLIICMPEDQEAILAAQEAMEMGYVDCVFVGNRARITELVKQVAKNFEPEIVDAEGEEDAAAKSVALIRSGRGKALMKGTIATPKLLKAVLNSENGIKAGDVLSHVLVYEWEGRFKYLTDGGMVPHPTLAEKQAILANAVDLARRLGDAKPKVAVLSALETVNLKMPSTVDAAVLAKMGERKQFGSCQVEGPLALDNAISVESAHHKGLHGDVVGQADILVCPDIDTGNVLGKSLMYFANVPAGGLIVGAKVPIILLSRADSKQTRLNSIKLALASGLN